jgi:hypothetical protein
MTKLIPTTDSKAANRLADDRNAGQLGDDDAN